MKKTLLLLFTFLVGSIGINAQIVISEIMYNSPDQDDVYEYIELYNSSEDTIDLKGFQFTDGIEHTFESYDFVPKSFLVLAKDSLFIADLNFSAIIWDNGGLKNKGETIVLSDSNNVTIDSVKYDDEGQWVTSPDGDGPSLELCDLTKDNSKGVFWLASSNNLNKTINGKELFGTPGYENSVSCKTEETPISLVINEIMYNDGVGLDTLEFIELLNNGEDTINLVGYILKTKAIEYTFPHYILKPNNTLVIAKNADVFNQYFGFSPLKWETGGLSNKSDTITIYNTNGEIIDITEYYDNGNWPKKADGQGYSLSLCDAYSDNNIGSNWQASPVYSGFKYKGNEIHANPGKRNYCSFDIDSLKELDSLGSIINKRLNPYISGIVYGINYNSNGLQFVIKDEFNKGIWTYGHNNNFDYDLHEGDNVELWGKLNQFKGLTQINLDSIILIKTDSILNPAIIVNKLDETTEGDLVTLNDVRLIDYTKWTNSGQGFNVKVTNSLDTFNIRIDSDTDIFGRPHPVGTFNITGLGGQYDKNKPYFDGYQLLPRYVEDITPYSAEKYPYKKINEVTQIDDEGTGLSNGESCEIRGLVYGINLKPNGLQFTLIDDINDGIGVFSSSEKYGYTVKEGDYISIKGTIDQYKGLIQIKPDTLLLISSDHTIFIPQIVTQLNESTESQLIKLENLTIKNLSDWKADGSSYNVVVTNGTNDFLMRIDNDVELSNDIAPNYTFNLTGIGGQYDSSAPYDEGYQILPRYASDIEKTSKSNDLTINDFKVYPNPSSDFIRIQSPNDKKVKSIEIHSINGENVLSTSNPRSINIKDLTKGFYKISIITNERVIIKSFTKM